MRQSVILPYIPRFCEEPHGEFEDFVEGATALAGLVQLFGHGGLLFFKHINLFLQPGHDARVGNADNPVHRVEICRAISAMRPRIEAFNAVARAWCASQAFFSTALAKAYFGRGLIALQNGFEFAFDLRAPDGFPVMFTVLVEAHVIWMFRADLVPAHDQDHLAFAPHFVAVKHGAAFLAEVIA